jgi:hypothetical protein
MTKEYQQYLNSKQQEWENLCIRCGGCCGGFDDPCLHLKKDNDNKYFCEIYQARFGQRKTVNGNKFNCVPIKEIIHTRWSNDNLCSYKRHIKMPWLAQYD